MTITFQQLRSAIPGAQPSQLDPGQVAFNVSDGTMYLGTGTDVKIDFSGTQVLPAPPAGKGWIQVLLEREALNEFFLTNPTSAGGAAPTNEQVLTWNSTRGEPEWQDAGTGFSYETTNAAVAAALGATTSEKISAAIGNPSYIGRNATCIVVGDPGSTYEGLYIFSGTAWVFGAHYAFNTASQVPAVNPMTLSAAATQAVLDALKLVDDGLQTQINSNDSDINTLQGEMSQAQSDIVALQINKLNKASNVPYAGQILSFDGTGQLWIDDSQGDVTSVSGTAPIVVDNTDPQTPIVSIDAATTSAPGAVQLSTALNSTSTTEAATPSAVKAANDAAVAAQAAADAAQATADAAVPRDSYAADGDILVGTGAGTFGPLGIGSEGQILTVVGGVPAWETDSPGDVTSVTGAAPITVDNTDPENPVVGVSLATTAAPGVVQVELTGNLTLVDGVINVPDASTTVKGAVQLNNTLSSNSTSQALTAAQGLALQTQINTLTLANNVVLAGGWDATNGVVDGVTTQGAAAGFVNGDPLPAPASGNADYYLICVVPGTDPSLMENGDWLLSDGTQWLVLGVGARPGSASYTQQGIVQLADAAAVVDGTSDTLAITPQALQDNVIDAVNVANSSQIASATAVKTAYDAAVAAQTSANNAQTTANAALPKAGGTMTGTIAAQTVNIQNTYSLEFAGGVNGSVNAISDATNVTSSTTAASASAAKAAYDAGVQGQTDAAAALAAANAAQTTADAAIPDATFTAAGQLLYGTGAGTYSVLPIGTNGQSLIVSGGSIAWGASLAGYTNSATPFNTAYGTNAGDAITTGLYNTCVGYDAGTGITAGDNNIVIGYQAGDGLSSGNNNTIVGTRAFSNTGGSNNTVLGYQAGTAMTTGNSNTIIGSSAGDSIASANSLVIVGQGAMTGVATGVGTVAIGASALQNLTSGTGNIAIGYTAGDSINTGSQNTVIGHTAGNTMTTATGNTILGFAAGQAITLGGQNVLIGSGAGDAITTGFNNTIIGDISGSTTLQGNVILAAGTTVKFQANNSGAWSPDGTNYGTAGQVLTSQGSGAVPTWTTPQIGDITAVTAGSGLTGGGSSGDVTLSLDPNAVIAPSVLTATGDIIYASAASTPANLAIGSAGQVLTVVGGVPAWAAAATGLTGITTATVTALGVNALDSQTTGSRNTAVGVSAGTAISSGNNNTAVGYAALDANTTGSDNTSIGNDAHTALTTGSFNTAVGSIAGDALTTGSNNVSIGYSAHGSAATPASQVAIGKSALQSSGATGSVAVGFEAGLNSSTATVTAIGFNALRAVTVGTANTAVGLNAGAVYTGSRSVFIGHNAGDAATTGNSNILIGADAGGAMTQGQLNIFIGDTAGDAVTTGSSNTIIGDIAGSATLANNLILGAGTNIKLQVNENNAIQVGNAGGYGTVGQVLTSNGSGAAASWTTISGGAVPATPTVEGIVYGYVDDTGAYDNVGLGIGVLGGTGTAGYGNTVVGWEAGSGITSGTYNVMVGWNAGQNITTESGNILLNSPGIVGVSNSFIVGNASTGNPYFGVNEDDAIGVADGLGGLSYGTAGQVLQSNGAAAAPTWVTPTGGLTGVTDAETTALGSGALTSEVAGVTNTALGVNAGTTLVDGDRNTFVGYKAGQSVLDTLNNTFIGHQAGINATGDGNTSVGAFAGPTGAALSCTFVGQDAGSISSGNNNVGVGASALSKATGGNNTAYGSSAGQNVTTGTLNTFIGFTAGSAVTTGSSNTILGDVNGTTTLSNNLILAAGTTIKLQVNENGAVGVGSTPAYGTAGAVLMSNGSGAAPTWTSSAALLPNYGSFLNTLTQTNLDTTNGNAVIFNTTTESRNVSVQNSSEITVASAGTYNIQISMQVTKTDAGTDTMTFWFQKNGVNVPNSATNLTLTGNNDAQLASLNFVITLAAGDNIELWWYSADANVQLLGEPAAGPAPAIPSVILTVVPVGA